MKTKKHLSDFIFVAFFKYDNIKRIHIESHTQVIRQIAVIQIRDRLSFNRVGISWKRKLILEKIPNRSQSLLTIYDIVSIGLRSDFSPIKLGNIVFAQYRIN